jgi:hypothetical protein
VGVFAMAGKTVDVREVWPGAPDEDATSCQLYKYLDCAVAYLQRHWVYDNPSAAAQLVETCHPLQLQLHAIKHAHGEIVNGGFCQFLFNSSGELAEEAVQGFQSFGLATVHQLLDELFSCFERPISKERLKRINMLFERFDPEKRSFRHVDEVFALPVSSRNIFEMSGRFFDPFDDRFYKSIDTRNHDRGFCVPVCRFVTEHRDIFFRSL